MSLFRRPEAPFSDVFRGVFFAAAGQVDALARLLNPARWLVAALSLACALLVCWRHPLSPGIALSVFYAGLVLFLFKPRCWLFVVPAALPVLNLFPWSGWLMVEEFDLLMLCVFAAVYGRMAFEAQRSPPAPPQHPPGSGWRLEHTLITLLALSSLASALRGFFASGFEQSFAQLRELASFQDYTSPLNSLRLSKSLVFALLCMPLLRRELGDPLSQTRAFKHLGTGVLAGLSIVVMVVVWERVAYPGLFNFSTPYRTTALFWEMHVGGAAIDAYFALTTPFVAWALARASQPRHWLLAAILALLTCYAVLTTFSRGVYLAVALPLLLLAAGRWAQKSGLDWRRPLGGLWRRRATFWLLVALVLEIALVAAGGSFLGDRMAQSQDDLGDRLTHWRRAVGLLQSPADWLLGKGTGRFVADYAPLGPDTEFSGSARLMRENAVAAHFQAVPSSPSEQAFVRLAGPQTDPDHGGLFMLNQRVAVPVAEWLLQAQARQAAPAYKANLELRAASGTQLLVKVCEKHLLYEGACLLQHLRLRGAGGFHQDWQRVAAPMRGDGSEPDGSGIRRAAVLSVSVLTAGASVDIRRFDLADPGGRRLASNPDFSNGMAHWFTSAGSYYLPWHVDNLYLEWLVERGLAGLACFLAVAGAALFRLAAAPAPARPQAAIVAAAIFGTLLLGLVSSVLDAPRVAFLLFFLVFAANQAGAAKGRAL